MDAPTYQADTVGGALDILTAAIRRIESEIRAQFPGDPKAQKAAKDGPLNATVSLDLGQLDTLVALDA